MDDRTTTATSVALRPAAREPLAAAPGRMVGRGAERRTLELLIDDVRAGRSGAILLTGEAGIGKTALLDHVRRYANDCRVLSVTGVASERALEHAGLHQICRSLETEIDALPAPQRTALRTALRLQDGVTPDRLFLGVAVLRVLAATAKQRPLVCLFDQADLLDPPSAAVLGFVARRLSDEGVALVAAAREPDPNFAAVRQLTVPRLSDADARALLEASRLGPIDPRVGERVIAEAAGNPGALLAVLRSAVPLDSGAGFREPAGTSLSPGFARRFSELPSPVRQVLLVAAVEPLGEPLLLWRAAEHLGLAATAVNAAEEAGLLELGVHVRFREATVRTAVHAAATPSERQAAHAAIAAVLADVAHLAIDPAWRAWHRGQAAAAPDEDVAADLAGHADPAVRIGGTSASAAFLRRAALLTPERDARARRALDAAEATSRAGDGDAAMKMLVEAEAVPLDQLGRARAELLRARIASTHGAPDAAQRLRAAARRLEPLDAERAGEAYLEALARAIERGPGAGCDAAAVARDALASRRPESRRPVDLLLEGLAQAVREGWSLRGGPLRRALDALAQDTTHATVLLAWGSVAADAAAACWDHHRQRALAERFAASAQELGALAARHEALAQLVEVRVREGRLTAAEAVLRDLHHGADGTARATATVAALLPAAYRGDADAVAALLGHLGDAAGEPLTGAAAVRAQTARLVLANGLGRHEEGLRGAEAVRRTAASGGAPAWALPELVEAAARSGAAHAVASAVEQLAETAAACGTDWAHGVAARARALVSDGPVAEALHREAIERLGRAGVDIEHARARLVYGEWLRGQGRRVDARAELRAAHAALQQMGAAGFAERARRELAATGEVVRRHGAEDRDELTAQELQIAQLAAAGASNREIGGRLYLSPRTVEWHLRKVFTKLGVGSRRSLGDALPAVAAS